MGDVVQALPVLRLLKHHQPASEIYWWLSSEFMPLLEGDPDLAGIFPFHRENWKGPSGWLELFNSVKQMRQKRFDLIIDLQGLARSGSFAWLANGQFTIGIDDPREGARAFYDWAVRRPSPQTHAVDWYLKVLDALGVPVHANFTWLPARPEAAAAVNRKWPADSWRWVIINPGARWLNKRWPVEHFSQLVQRLSDTNPNLRFAILGGTADASFGRAIAQTVPSRCVDLTGRTSLLEMVEWIRRAALIVTNDTGPMHVAAALGVRVLALFGPTDPRRTGPYGQIEGALRIQLPCSPCLKPVCYYEKPIECLRRISPEQACNIAIRRLELKGSGGAPRR